MLTIPTAVTTLSRLTKTDRGSWIVYISLYVYVLCAFMASRCQIPVCTTIDLGRHGNMLKYNKSQKLQNCLAHRGFTHYYSFKHQYPCHQSNHNRFEMYSSSEICDFIKAHIFSVMSHTYLRAIREKHTAPNISLTY